MPQPLNQKIQTMQALDANGNVVEVLVDANGHLIVQQESGQTFTVTPASTAVFETKETASLNRDMISVMGEMVSELKRMNVHLEALSELDVSNI